MTKKLLILVFVNKKDKIKQIEFIEDEFNVNSSDIFIFENLDNPSQYIFTFYIEIGVGEFIKVKDYFRNGLIIHKKRNTFYSINALNKLIEREYDLEVGNINYKKWKIDWFKYDNQIILNSGDNLSFISIKRVF
jgi:hypothetical protein